jgi:hypothetical protein
MIMVSPEATPSIRVLYVVTVHYSSPRWIEIQSRYLREHLSVPFEVWTSLERIDPCFGSFFDRVFEQRGRHPGKLNHLALEVSHVAGDEDLLMFLDGDAFPIADPMPLIEDGLARAPLVAVRRAENLGDPQPHPCFCVTTVGAWRALPGDWSGGYTWVNDRGERVTDVGANLLRALELKGTPWVQVLRSNRHDIDPLFFGVYGDIVYHHGAAFRSEELSRAHLADAPAVSAGSSLPLLGRVTRRGEWRERQEWLRQTHARYLGQSKALYERIERGDPDWLAELI